MELEFFKQEQLYRLLLKTEQQTVLSANNDSTIDINYAEKNAKFLEKISDMGKDELANYIVHRKTMLDILERALEYVDNENNRYEKRQASAFRKSGNFMQSINEYYSLIGHRISETERQNFLAFSQHHGLPTSLLDVTSNPLYALFFACHEAKENGYVYIFSKLVHVGHNRDN